MNPAPWSWKQCWTASACGWNQFFHQPADRRLLSLLRMGYAILLLINILSWWPDLTRWFGETGVLPWHAANELRDPSASTVFAWLPKNDAALYACYAIFILQAVLLLLGVFPRLQAVCTFVWLVSFIHRQPLLWNSEDAVMRLFGFYLLWLPLQLTAWLRWKWWPAGSFSAQQAAAGKATEESSAWALRLFQIQMCIIFADAAFAKLHGDIWLDGTAVYYSSRLDEFAVIGSMPNFLFETPWIVRTLTWGTIAIELLVPLFVWFRETRRLALLAALVFHLACAWSMHLFLFHWLMLLGWCAFLSCEELDFCTSLVRWKRNKSRSQGTGQTC